MSPSGCKKITTKLVDFAQSMEAAKSQACFRKPCQYFNILAFGIYNLQSKIADTVPATGDLQVILREAARSSARAWFLSSLIL